MLRDELAPLAVAKAPPSIALVTETHAAIPAASLVAELVKWLTIHFYNTHLLLPIFQSHSSHFRWTEGHHIGLPSRSMA